MRTVITISLNGNAYQLDAGGYEALRAYLQVAEQRLAGNPDQLEILADLEQAIADKCRRYLGPHKNVVNSEEVAEVLREMGPVDGDAEASQAAASGTAGASGGASGATGTMGAESYAGAGGAGGAESYGGAGGAAGAASYGGAGGVAGAEPYAGAGGNPGVGQDNSDASSGAGSRAAGYGSTSAGAFGTAGAGGPGAGGAKGTCGR